MSENNQIKTDIINTINDLIGSLTNLKEQLEDNKKPSEQRIKLLKSRLEGMLSILHTIETK